MRLRRVISGCQTGADQGGLEAAVVLGLETGGHVTLGNRTEDGERPDLIEKYGLTEMRSIDYPSRTLANVREADATLIFGRENERGTKLTIKYCKKLEKPYAVVVFDSDLLGYAQLKQFFDEHDPEVINVAGNRESKWPDLQELTRKFLVRVINDLRISS